MGIASTPIQSLERIEPLVEAVIEYERSFRTCFVECWPKIERTVVMAGAPERLNRAGSPENLGNDHQIRNSQLFKRFRVQQILIHQDTDTLEPTFVIPAPKGISDRNPVASLNPSSSTIITAS